MEKPLELHKLTVEDVAYETTLPQRFLARQPFVPADPKKVRAHIPGLIRGLDVSPGSEVKAGDRLLCLEAMKMENVVRANRAGRIRAVRVELGAMVTKGAVLVEFE